MATTAKKVAVKVTQTVPVKDTSFASISGAKDLVGAPDSALVSTGGNAAPVNPPVEGQENDYYPYAVTFSWSEDK